MRKYILATLLLFSCLHTYAQQNTIDSFKNLLQGNVHDTMRIKYMKALANLYAPLDSTTAFGYMQQGIDLARQKKLPRFEAIITNETGFLFEQYGNLATARDYYRKAVAIAVADKNYKTASNAYSNLNFAYKDSDYDLGIAMLDSCIKYARLGGHKAQEANGLNNRGSQRVFKGMYDVAMKDLVAALKIYQELNDSVSIISTYTNIGNNYNQLKQFDKAIQYLNTGLAIAEKKNSPTRVMEILVNLSSAYYYKRDMQKSIALSKRIVELYNAGTPNHASYASALSNLGVCYKDLGNYPLAIKYFEEALPIQLELKDIFNYCTAQLSLGEAYAAQKQNQKALASFQKVLDQSLASNYKIIEQVALQNLAEINYRMGNGNVAYKLLEHSFNLRDTLYNKDMAAKVTELETKYSTAQKETQIANLNKQNSIQELKLSQQRTMLFAVLVCSLLLVFSLFMLQRSRRLRKEAQYQQQLKLAQEKATAAMIEAELNERRRIAGELHDGVGQVFSAARMNLSVINEHLLFDEEQYRNIYEKSVSLIDDGCRELRSVSHMMMPEVLMKKGLTAALQEMVDNIAQSNLQINLNIHGFPADISRHMEMTLYRVTQETINNALKHANAKHIDIQLNHEDDIISLTIEDDGIGFDTTKMNPAAGMGLKNMLSRVNLLQGTIEIESRPGSGTVVAVTLPMEDVKV